MKKLFSISNVKKYVDTVAPFFKNVVKDKKISVFNVPCSFDIETSSFIDKDGNKVAIMYEFSFAIFDYVIIGRTWEDYKALLDELIAKFGVSDKKQLIIYVHNLAYEFQFMRKLFEWERVFAIKERTPIYALEKRGIMYKCSLQLSGYKLSKVAENLHHHKIHKLIGDLDYKKIRTPKTPLKIREIMYCINDVRIVTAYISEQIEECGGSIAKIPLTQTGFVRNFVRENTMFKEYHGRKYRSNYAKQISKLKMVPEEYGMLKRAFQGGFTHANHNYVGKTMEKVTSFDFTSSYPAVMLTEKFPMSSGIEVKITNEKQFKNLLDCYCIIFDIVFYNLKAKFDSDHYISYAKSYWRKNVDSENGRVYHADEIGLTITNIDYEIIKATYDYDEIKIGKCYVYYRDYLPKPFLQCIIHFYKQKNLLKHVKGKEVEYMKAKQMLNSLYGMCVTDIVKDLHCYDTDWKVEKADLAEKIESYNKNWRRFLAYPWGVFVTAYARRNLWIGITNVDNDYIYSDTDSIKILNGEKHMDFINGYNAMVRKKLELSFKSRGLNINDVIINGRMIGAWDYDGFYSKFKTLGAKRYLVTYENGENMITVAGLGKEAGIKYLQKKYGDSLYSHFKNDLYIPKGKTGKNIHTYIDEKREGSVKDYLGNDYNYVSESGTHLDEADFTLSLNVLYIQYLLLGLKGNYIM